MLPLVPAGFCVPDVHLVFVLELVEAQKGEQRMVAGKYWGLWIVVEYEARAGISCARD